MISVLLRCAAILFLVLAGFGSTASQAAGQNMLDAYNQMLDTLIYAAAALAAFSLVWAAFTLMWGHEGPDASAKAKGAIAGTVTGLMLTLLAKGIVVLLVDQTSVLLPTR